MTEPATPAELARAFIEAWTSHDMDTAATYLADDVTFDGPSSHSDGKEAYMQGLAKFARVVTGVQVRAALGDESQAVLFYDLATAPFGTLTSAELLTFREGKIVADVLTFDTLPVRGNAPGAQQAPAAAPPAPSGAVE